MVGVLAHADGSSCSERQCQTIPPMVRCVHTLHTFEYHDTLTSSDRKVTKVTNLRQAAQGFADCFPDVELDTVAFIRAERSLRDGGSRAQTALGGFVVSMLTSPPVDRMLIPFIQAITVRAAALFGLTPKVAEQVVQDVIASATADLPLSGLVIAVGAPRRALFIDSLANLDSFITGLHEALAAYGAHPVGPQEHPGSNRDQSTSTQWTGHLTSTCEPIHNHDALIAIEGPSLGLGESVDIAKRLGAPVFGVQWITKLSSGDSVEESSPGHFSSCRMQTDGYAIQNSLQVEAGDSTAPERVVRSLCDSATAIRRRQRRRIMTISKYHR